MPRTPRLHVPGAMYHVTLRGNHRQNIFFSAADRRLMSDLFAEVIGRFGARLHAYCYMTNHIHALIQVSEAPLGRIMLRVAGRYARQTQAKLHTTGHLFEKRYYPVLIDADEYLLELLRYVHLNPVRAHMVETADEYPWSSHHAYCGERDEPWVTTDLALSMFHHQRGVAIQAYRQFVGNAVGKARASPLQECNTNDRRILGSDDFAGRVLGESWKPRSPKTLDELISEACAKFYITRAELESSNRRAALVKSRAWIVRQAINGRICSIAAVARALNRNESTLRRALERHALQPP
jgi:putative transposase